MTLSRQLPFGLFIFGFLMMSATYFMLAKSESLLKNYTLTGLEREVQLLTNLIEQNLLERYHNASIFPLVLGGLDSEEDLKYTVTDPEFLDSLNQLVKNYKVYRRIAILDLSGNIIAENSKNHLGRTLSNANLSPAAMMESSWFREVEKSNNVEEKVFFYGPSRKIIDTSDKQFDLLIGSRITSENGEIIGYWLNILDFAIVEESFGHVYKLLAEKGLPYVELTLINDKGEVIIDYDPISQGSAKYQRDFSVLGQLNLVKEGVEGARLAVTGLTGSVLSNHARKNIKQFTAYTHFEPYVDLPTLGWSTLIRVEEDIAYQRYADLRQWNYWLFALLFLFITAMSLFALKVFTTPIKKVTKSVLELAKGNLDADFEKREREDEVSSINNALIELKAKLIEREGLISEIQDKQQLVELQKKAMNAMASGIVISDVSDSSLPIIYVNKAIELLTGYRSEEMVNKNFRYLWGDNTEKISAQIIDEAIERKEGCTCVITNYKKDRTTYINNLSVDPVFDDKGELTHYIFVHNDITEIKKDDEIARFALEKRIEDSVRDSEEAAKRLRTVFDTALDGSVVMDQDGIIVDVNHSLEVIFGRTKSELVGKNVSVLMTSEHAANHDQYIRNYFQGGIRKFIGELRTVKAVHKSGRVIPIEISIGETKLETETIFVAAIRDISEQQEIKEQQLSLQNQLKERETIYRTAFNQAAVGIARVSVQGRMLEVNKRMCDSLGYTEDELLGLSVEDITYQEDIEISQQYLQSLADGEHQFYTLDKRYIRKDRSVFWANLSISLVRSEDGKPKYYISIVEDITERKSFEQELKDARDQRDELIGGINLASQAGGICNWSYNMVTDELKWDSRTYALYGIKEGERLTYSDWRERIIPADIHRIDDEISLARDRHTSLESEFRFTKKGSTEVKWARLALAITQDERGELTKMFGIFIDITEQKRITSELEKETIAAQKANEAKSSFLATMSHEIRTPMNGVIGMIDLLKKTALNSDQKRMTSTIRDSSYALLEIINDILDFSKIESGQIEIDWSATSILSLMEKTAGSLCVNAANKNVDLIIEHDVRTPKFVLVDSMRLSQIMLNLVGNAIKFSHHKDKRGVVRLTSRFNHTSSELTIEVIDNGIGISSEQLRSLFVPFSQADSSTTRKYGGTGLGLSISKSFAELMGGEISVASEVAKGSNFSVKLPIARVDDKAADFEPQLFEGFDFYVCLQKPAVSNSCVKLLKGLGASEVFVIEDGEHPAELNSDNAIKSVLIYDTRSVPSPVYDDILRLHIDDDPIKKKGYIGPYQYAVNGLPLKPSEFVYGLTILCGLESPVFSWSNDYSDSEEANGITLISSALTEGKEVLVVEDHPTNQLVIGRQLDCLGVKYAMSSDGVEGLEAWEHGNYALILSDCHMPNMDGFELTRRIREIETEQGLLPTPIIAITANALVGESDSCLNAGMNDYIAKPVEVEQLRTVLTKWLKNSSSEFDDIEAVNGEESKPDNSREETGLDLDALFAVIGTDDKEIVNEILAMYWDSIQTELGQIDEAIKAEDFARLKSLAHAAKGSSASSGAKVLSGYFKEIEFNPDKGEMVSENLRLIRDELGNVEQQLKGLGVI